MNNKVEPLGSLMESTAPFIEVAKKELIRKEKRRINVGGYVPIEARQSTSLLDDFSQDEETKNTIKNEINEFVELRMLLQKAGIDGKFYPFKPIKNKEGEIIGFEPKGKNEKEIKENIEKYKEKLEEAFKKGKINQKEFDKLNDNLEEKEIEMTDRDILNNIKQFVVRNYGNVEEFEKDCEHYENLGLEDRKFKLQEVNSKINSQLGIAGDLRFSNNPNLKFENSFFDKGVGGYYLTEEEVQKQGLANALYSMMEKSMIRKIELDRNKRLSSSSKKSMHEKIMKEKMKREATRKQENTNRKNARRYIRNMFG